MIDIVNIIQCERAPATVANVNNRKLACEQALVRCGRITVDEQIKVTRESQRAKQASEGPVALLVPPTMRT